MSHKENKEMMKIMILKLHTFISNPNTLPSLPCLFMICIIEIVRLHNVTNTYFYKYPH